MTSKTAAYNELLLRATRGDEAAFTYLVLFNQYSHTIDDIIDDGRDGKPMDAERVIGAFMQCAHVHSHPFYVRHAAHLHPVMLMVANAYADSVAWEKSDQDGPRTMADVLRCAGNEMVLAVAAICGGWAHMRSLSAELRMGSWSDHHTPAGLPI